MRISPEQKKEHESIQALCQLISSDTMSVEVAQYTDMLSRKKEALVRALYFENRKTKEFYTCGDGRIKSRNPQFVARTEEELLEKLYNFYFHNTLEGIYKDWVRNRSVKKLVSKKTIEEDIGVWRRTIGKSTLADKSIADIKPRHLMNLFEEWTGDGSKITRKEFNTRKTLLNGIFKYAILHEIIEINPVNSIAVNELNFKLPNPKKKAYTIEERKQLLDYLDTLVPDAYVLAIKLAFRGIFRIGEIKGLTDFAGETVTIRQQLVGERDLRDDFTLGRTQKVLKDPKGNPYYSVRTEQLPPEGIEILCKMRNLNPDGVYLFMHEGRPLTTDTFNRRLMKYTKAIGIPYLSSHKIRFTGASMLYNAGVKAIDIQPLLGHSTLTMTEHYIGERVTERDTSQMARLLV